MERDEAKTLIVSNQESLRHNLGYAVYVAIHALKRDGLYDAWLSLRPNSADLADNQYDIITLGQAQLLGLL